MQSLGSPFITILKLIYFIMADVHIIFACSVFDICLAVVVVGYGTTPDGKGGILQFI